ncbi:MAG: glutamate mutase L, partial [Chloroflexota bacterium]
MSQRVYPEIESVLVADCGSNTTRVVLVEVVEQAYRFIARGEAPSTLEEPYNDVTIGVLNAIEVIQTHTGRQLLVGGRLLVPQQDDGTGIDAFVACSSAAEPLRVVVAGLVHNLSAESANRASHGTYTTVLDTISMDDYGDNPEYGQTASASDYDPDNPEAEFSPFASRKDRPNFALADADTPAGRTTRPTKKKKGGLALFNKRQRHGWKERQVAKLRRLAPNVVILAGGSDGAPIDSLLELIGVFLETNRQEALLANATGEIRRPLTVVYAANHEGREALIEKNQGQLELFLVDNIRPSLDRENLMPLQVQLAALYQERLLPTLSGYRRLTEMSSAPVNTTCSAVGLMTQFLAKDVADNRVLTADLGGSNAALFYADATDFVSMVRGGFGLSFGLSNVLTETTCDNLRRWLPFEIGDDELVHYALNKILRPQILPANQREVFIEGAFGREILLRLGSQLHSQTHAGQRNGQFDYNRLIGVGGPLVNINIWQAALLLLDGLQPPGGTETGLLELELDSTMLMAASGALAVFNPNAAAYLFRYDCLHRLGPVIVPIGEGSLGSPAVTVKMTTERGRVKQATVPYGSITLLPLRSDEKASLEIKPEGNFRIGRVARGSLVRTAAGQEMRGGALGLII